MTASPPALRTISTSLSVSEQILPRILNARNVIVESLFVALAII